jgi:hypothetical protein
MHLALKTAKGNFSRYSRKKNELSPGQPRVASLSTPSIAPLKDFGIVSI